MSKKTKNSTLTVFVASICLFALTPSLALASELRSKPSPSASHATTTTPVAATSKDSNPGAATTQVAVGLVLGSQTTTQNQNGPAAIAGNTTVTIIVSKSPTPTSSPTHTPKPTHSPTPDPKPSPSQPPPSFTPTTRPDPCTTTHLFSFSLTHSLSLFNLATLDTTHCKKIPEIPKKEPPYTFYVKSKTYFNVNGSKIAYVNEPANYFAPDGTTNGKPTPEVGVPPTGCLNSSYLDFNRVTLNAYGVKYTDAITNQTTTTTYATGPQTSKTATTARSTTYSGCVYPGVVVLRSCVVGFSDFLYSGVTGNNVDNQIIIPTGPVKDPKVIAGSWIPDNATFTGPGNTYKNQTTETVSNPATWLYQPATPVSTKLGSDLQSPSKLASLFVSSAGALITPLDCGSNGQISSLVSVPTFFVTPGEYTLRAGAQVDDCYVLTRDIGKPEFVGCYPANPQVIQKQQIFSKTCTSLLLGSSPGTNYSSKLCPTPTPTPTPTVSPTPTPTVSATPKPTASASPKPTPTVVPVVAPVFVPISDYSCSIKGNPKVVNPLGSQVSSATTIQALSQAVSSSGSNGGTPWALTWNAPTFTSYGSMDRASLTEQGKSTALILSAGYALYKYNEDSTAPDQPVTATPNLSLTGDANPYTLPGWNVPSTITFYKKGDTNSKITVTQEAVFTARFRVLETTIDPKTGRSKVIETWQTRTGYCPAEKSVSFQVVGVKALP